MKKLIPIIAIILILVGCGSNGEVNSSADEKNDVNTLINAGNISEWKLEDAVREFGELTPYGPYDEDGMTITYYQNSDNTIELGFVADDTKLKTVYLYIPKEPPFNIEREKDIFKVLGIAQGENVKKDKNGAARYYDLDEDNKIREAYFMGDSVNFPMNVELIQIWYKWLNVQ